MIRVTLLRDSLGIKTEIGPIDLLSPFRAIQ